MRRFLACFCHGAKANLGVEIFPKNFRYLLAFFKVFLKELIETKTATLLDMIEVVMSIFAHA